MNKNVLIQSFARFRIITISALIALMLVLGGCAISVTPSPEPTLTAGETEAQGTAQPLFGDFKAKDIEGNDVTNEIFANSDVTMVNIWASFCSPCVNEMPDLAELNEEYADRGFQIVGIILDATDDKGNVNDAILADGVSVVESTGADYTHIIPSAAMLGAYLKDISAVPTTVFVNSKGEVIGSSYVGSRSKADWAKIIEDMLG